MDATLGGAFVPANDAFGTMFNGFADGKNCGRLFSTSDRWLSARSCGVSASTFCVEWFTPNVNSEKVEVFHVCSSVFTMPNVGISYFTGNCGQPPVLPSSAYTPPLNAS